MRIALSILVCVFAALVFSLSAQANYSEEFNLYNNCKKAYPNGSCDSLPLFSKKSLIEQSSKCQLSSDVFSSLENSITCTTVNSINKTCFDKFQPQVTQQISNYCSAEIQKTAQATAASSQRAAASAPAQQAQNKDGGGPDLKDLAKAGGAVLKATGLDDKIKDYAKSVIKDGGFSNPFKNEPAQAQAPVQNQSGSSVPGDRAVATDNSDLRDNEAIGKTTPDFRVNKSGAEPENKTADVSENKTADATAPPAADSEIKGQAEAAAKTLPAAAKEINKVKEASAPGAEKVADGAKTEITQTAEQLSAELEKLAKDVETASKEFNAGLVPFSKTSAALLKVKEQINKYVSVTKKTCTSASEKAGFLCLEGTSPGMQAAKTTMDVAGPALALINSAQKSCSATADVTRLVGTGLTIAKGVCVAAKLYCDFSCSSAVKELAAIETARKAVGQSVAEDFMVASKAVSAESDPIVQSKMISETQGKGEMSKALQEKFSQTLAKEKAPTLGTSPSLVVKCQDHMKDIGLLAANIAGVYKAQQNAKQCADKLKTGGDKATVAEYCAQPANVETSYCKCQRDNTQQGCAGHLVTSSTFDRKADDKGSVLRNGGGASAFAGPGVNGANINAGGINSPISTSGSNLGVAEKLKDSNSAATGYTGGSGSGGALGSRSGDSSSGSEAGTGEEKDKKKWSFGAFTGGFGGFGGGSGSAKDGSSKVGQKNLDIQRAIASEKQWRAEVTSSSGKSNFEKVRESYLKKTTSLLDK